MAVPELLLALSLSASTPGVSKTTSGIELARACRISEGEGSALCKGFIEGFTFGTQMAVKGKFIDRWDYAGTVWCIPSGTGEEAIRKLYLDYAGAHAGDLHFPATIVLSKALAASFPCL